MPLYRTNKDSYRIGTELGFKSSNYTERNYLRRYTKNQIHCLFVMSVDGFEKLLKFKWMNCQQWWPPRTRPRKGNLFKERLFLPVPETHGQINRRTFADPRPESPFLSTGNFHELFPVSARKRLSSARWKLPRRNFRIYTWHEILFAAIQKAGNPVLFGSKDAKVWRSWTKRRSSRSSNFNRRLTVGWSGIKQRETQVESPGSKMAEKPIHSDKARRTKGGHGAGLYWSKDHELCKDREKDLSGDSRTNCWNKEYSTRQRRRPFSFGRKSFGVW